MSAQAQKKRSVFLIVAVVVSLALFSGAFVWLLLRAEALPDGVRPIVWDKEVCAECRMHIGEPRFAAQVQLVDGRVLNFDDPGCVFRMAARNDPSRGDWTVHAMYFHDVTVDRWIRAEEVAFIEVEHSPMGYGLGATPKSQPHGVSFDDASERVLRRHQEESSR